jgi:hypothetical protein
MLHDQPPDETPWPVEPKPPRATLGLELVLTPLRATEVPPEVNAAELDEDERPHIQPEREPQLDDPDPECELPQRRFSRHGSAGCAGRAGLPVATAGRDWPGGAQSVRGASA